MTVFFILVLLFVSSSTLNTSIVATTLISSFYKRYNDGILFDLSLNPSILCSNKILNFEYSELITNLISSNLHHIALNIPLNNIYLNPKYIYSSC